MKQYNELLTLYKQPFELVRLGRQCDGGYIVPVDLICNNLLSCGISTEISFEQDYLKHISAPNIHCFDGTIANFPSNDLSFNWHKLNIGSRDTDSEVSLNTIFDKCFKTATDIFVKMDIECAEYASFDTIAVENLQKINCLVLEVHNIDCEYAKFKQLMDILQKELVLVHKHDNNCGRYFSFENKTLADVYELTFINKKYLVELQVNDVQLPIQGLDFNNR